MTLAEDPAPPGQGIFIQVPRRLGLPGCAQEGGEVAGGHQRVGVVLAQDAPTPGQGILIQPRRPIMLAQFPQGGGDGLREDSAHGSSGPS